VTAASKHGATAEIAVAIAEVLAGNGLDPAKPDEDPVDVAEIVTLRAPAFRDWPEIRRWATQIAAATADARR
jgi:menaquinone-dependent protoporphyrinogen IX oxidase